MIDALRADRLDAVITTLPAPTNGLRIDAARRAASRSPSCPSRTRLALDGPVALERLAPDRLVVLPREANPAFHNAVVAMCHDAGLSPTFVEPAESRAWSMSSSPSPRAPASRCFPRR